MKRFVGIILFLGGLFGQGIFSAAHADGPLQVTVSILPQKHFVERIGGDCVAVSVMVEPGAEPHVYDPKPQQMAALAKSSIYFAIGVPFEDAWLEKFAAANPAMRIVHTETDIRKIPMKGHDHHGKQHGGVHPQQSSHHDHHEVFDPHVWLSPPLVMIQARTILNALLQVDPAHESLYEANYRRFTEELINLDLELLNRFRDTGGNREFMVFHPAWGYFAWAYGLEQTPIEIEGKEPKAAELKLLIEHARARNIKIVFVQPQFSSTSARVIAEGIGGQVIIADPMALEWAKNLREVAEKIRPALK